MDKLRSTLKQFVRDWSAEVRKSHKLYFQTLRPTNDFYVLTLM